ncbi:hypothetical protein [Vulgatibacter incomptus]|uniref:Lipoprotein n=1 Tax=Vulgatibacter incomptus TaxID=1391653 RepID=A0A0K1PFY2_9BACT|nr:hypothetical protein [Vulgatibacter incomptus]AKU92443.1 hypothetical protein AKJ08_2830 [Vulgatibacter incomptus]
MRSRLALVALLSCTWLALFGGSPGCQVDNLANGPACTEMACLDSLTVTFDPPLTATGRYELALDLDGRAFGCEIMVSGIISPTSCGDVAVTVYGPSRSVTHSIDGETVSHSEVPLPGIAEIRMFGAPHAVGLGVRRDGFELVRTSFEPAYERFYPNGPRCGDMACDAATRTIQVP